MDFGYFTLSDNHYENNPRTPNQFVADITQEALYADTLGMHSAWIGEHHFNSLGVLSCPDLVLAYIAARTRHIRLAPAVTVTPLHDPISVAEQWATLDLLSGGRVDFAAGRGYEVSRHEKPPRTQALPGYDMTRGSASAIMSCKSSGSSRRQSLRAVRSQAEPGNAGQCVSCISWFIPGETASRQQSLLRRSSRPPL